MSVFGPPPLPSMPIWQDFSEIKKVEENPLNTKNLAEIISGSAVFAGLGYGVYWIIRFIDKKKWLEIDPKAIQPIPYVLIGAINAAIPAIVVVVNDFALYLIGNREDFENLADPQTASFSDRLRNRCWKIIVLIEGLEEEVDALYSRTFNVRTSKEIRENQIQDRDLAFMEIVRYALVKQIQETSLEILRCIPGEVGVYTAEALGYTVLGGHFFMFFIYLAPITAVMGVALKVIQVKERIDDEFYKEYLERTAENKAYCDLLYELYPVAEFFNEEREEVDAEIVEEQDDGNPKEFLELPKDVEIVSIEGRKAPNFGLKAEDHEDIAFYRRTPFLDSSKIQWLKMRNEDVDDYRIDGIQIDDVDDDEINLEEAYIEVDESDVPVNFIVIESELADEVMTGDVVEVEPGI